MPCRTSNCGCFMALGHRCDNHAMPVSPTTHELTVRNGDVSLAGSLWLPPDPVGVTVLMHPGSGPSDRDNDVFFPPIREQLLDSGVAVSSFDKRGVGESSSRWQDAAIEEQASDAVECLEALRADTSLGGPVGLYGHSQGGWVVIDAAARCSHVAFVVTSSGPGVTPGEQERWATRVYMAKAGIPESEIEEVGRYYDRVISMMRSGVGLADAREQLEAEGFPQAFETLSLPVLPDDEADWQLMAAMIDYDPRPALERLEVPILAAFGAEDPIVPVEESIAVFREAVRPDLLQVEVFEGAGHRLEIGDPPAFVDGYFELLASFIVRAGI
jgi:pimeloyl-ACP methyl ester carboxylesterase